MTGSRHAVKKGMGALLHYSGLGKRLGRPAPNILTFHRIVADGATRGEVNSPLMTGVASFGKLLDRLAGRVDFVTLERLVQWLQGKGELSPGSLVLTFDDGYLDNYRLAYPLLKKYRVPATVFLATDYIGAASYLWWDEVAFFFGLGCPCPLPPGVFSGPVQEGVRAIARAAAHERQGALNRLIRTVLYRVSPEERHLFVRHLGKELAVRGVSRPRLMLEWDEVREMAGSGLVSFQPHTASHCLLDQITPAAAAGELAASREAIERVTGVSCRYFAYPAGHLPQGGLGFMREAGIEAAVTTRYGAVPSGCDPLLIPRKDAGYCFVDGEFHLPYFMTVCSNALDRVRKG